MLINTSASRLPAKASELPPKAGETTASNIWFSISGLLAMAILVLSQLAAGCGSDPKESKPASQRPAKADSAMFAEPELAAQTFIGAAASADQWLISQSLSEHCLPEFQDLRSGESSEEQLKELSAIFANARVGKVTKNGDNALVEIVLIDGSETLEMIQTSNGWRIIGFE